MVAAEVTAGVAAESAPVEFTAFHPTHKADPYAVYQRVREARPLCPFMLGDIPVTVLTRYADCEAVLQSDDWVHGYDAGISPFRDGAASAPRSFLRMDPPDHTRLRGLVNKAFTPRIVNQMAPGIQALADRLVDGALATGSLDVISGYAALIASATLGHLLGVPDDVGASLRGWALAIARGTDPDNLLTEAELVARRQATQDFQAYFEELIAQRRANPTDDLISRMAAARDRDDALSELELLGVSSLLVVAGMETSINYVGSAVLSLLRHPDQLALLRARPELLPSAVEEVLRYDPPTQFTMRTACRETELAGHTFDRGDGVLLVSAAAGRDPAAFTDPDRFDITRYHGPRPARRHLGFSVGIHFCLGAPLARIEAAAAIGALVHRTTALELAVDESELVYLPSLIHRALATLPVRVR
ncbi:MULTISPECIES: cytochrome P450 [unclassified Parafrankia]|uniref:cytochrome P450 n=1 Tax=Parafrankia TaxID=2994362 RepID=UPI000DA44128|nr:MULTISPECIES: cytochrome P450 [unclassified Parafrankia]TCJ31928.1 cytochrome P450 [Parafrankia sp. BMG5.11]CAI7977113.1 Cytochrome P450 [Frankia sp. Hr75.2]SQD95939.1 Cytochrome P450 [Parafrankia sp. Ea1.12]